MTELLNLPDLPAGSAPLARTVVAVPGAAGGEVVKFAADPGTPKTRFIKFEEVKSARPELSDASVIVSGGFAVRSALLNVMRPLSLRLGLASASDTASDRSSEKPDATLERLARMVRTERNREALHPHPALRQVQVA